MEEVTEYAKYVRNESALGDKLEEVFQVVIDDRRKV